MTHITQPLDVGVFGPVKTKHRSRSHHWTSENPGKVLNKISMITDVARPAFETALSKTETVIKAFEKTGIFPFNPAAANREKLKAGTILTRQPRGVWRTGAERQRKISSVSLAVHTGLTLSLYQAPALSTLLRTVLQQVLNRLSSLGLPRMAPTPPLPHLQLTDLHQQPPHQALDLCQASPPAALHLCLP